MFSKRQEQELAEIKSLTRELAQRFDAIQSQLQRIEGGRQGGGGAGKDQAEPAKRAKAGRASGSGGAKGKSSRGQGKKAARRQKAAVVAEGSAAESPATGGKGKRQGKQGGKQGRKAARTPQAAKRNGDAGSSEQKLASSAGSDEG